MSNRGSLNRLYQDGIFIRDVGISFRVDDADANTHLDGVSRRYDLAIDLLPVGWKRQCVR